MLDAKTKGDKETTIFFQADKGVDYGDLMSVMNNCARPATSRSVWSVSRRQPRNDKTRSNMARYGGSLAVVLGVHVVAVLLTLNWSVPQAIELPPQP
jgi:hypothetical protein